MTVLLPFRRHLLSAAWCRNLLWKSARAVPSLDLDFAGNKSLKDGISNQDLITHTRASSATFTGSDGVLRSAVTNLKTFSDAILVANAYSANTSTLTTVTTPTPTASTTASLFTLNAGANTGNNTDGFNFGSGTTLTNSTQHTQSLFVKPAGATVLRLRSNVSGILFDFTLTGSGTAPSISSDLQGASIVLFPNGWYRVFWTFTTTTSAPGNRGDYWTIKTNVADGTNGLYVVGAQLEQASTVGDYVPTTSTINSAPRFDHNPTTGESLGLLVEEARTNLQTFSEEFNNAAYGASAGSVSGVNAGIAPNGTSTADEITSTGGGLFRSLTVVTATVHTASIYAKYVSGGAGFSFGCDSGPTNGRTVFNLQTGAITSNGANVTSSSIAPVGNDWYRCTVTFTSTSTSIILVYYNATSGSKYLIWGAQLEAAAFPTSYIPTTTATVTRAADLASITGSNFSSWYNQTEGTVLFDGRFNTIATNTAAFSIYDSASPTNNRHSIRVNNTIVTSAGTGVAFFFQTPALQAVAKYGYGYAANNFCQVFNSSDIAVDTSGALPIGVNAMDIGKVEGSQIYSNGTIKRLTYWPTRLSNTTIQQITQP